MPSPKKQKKVKKSRQVNWQRVISLSAAGQYIQDRLREELENLKPTPSKKNIKPKKS